MTNSQQNDSPDVTSAGTALQVKNPCGNITSYIVADEPLNYKHRGEFLAKVYRIILEGERGQA